MDLHRRTLQIVHRWFPVGHHLHVAAFSLAFVGNAVDSWPEFVLRRTLQLIHPLVTSLSVGVRNLLDDLVHCLEDRIPYLVWIRVRHIDQIGPIELFPLSHP